MRVSSRNLLALNLPAFLLIMDSIGRGCYYFSKISETVVRDLAVNRVFASERDLPRLFQVFVLKGFPLSASAQGTLYTFPCLRRLDLILFDSFEMEPSVSCVPEFCGKRLIPALIDDIARIDPDRPFVSIPMTLDPRDGFKDVSYRSFADAVDRCAWWLEKQLGTSSTFETITYLSHGRDFAYFILTLAAIKTGYKVCIDGFLCGLQTDFSTMVRRYIRLQGTVSRLICR